MKKEIAAIPDDGVRLYRLEELEAYDGVSLYLRTYRVHHYTKSGYWVIEEHEPYFHRPFSWLRENKRVKHVMERTMKKVCYKTLKGAVDSFISRKKRQLEIYMGNTRRVQYVIDNSEKLHALELSSFKDGYALIGKPEYYDCMLFEE